MKLKELRPNEQEKYSTTKEVVGLGCTDTAIRRGRTKLGCTRKTLLKYIRWYESEDISLFSHHNKGHKPVTTKPEEGNQEKDGEEAEEDCEEGEPQQGKPTTDYPNHGYRGWH